MSERKNLQDRALDAAVYLPVGALLTARDEFPKLAAKGRAYVTTQLTMAKTVGNFAVTFGSREAEKQVLKAVRRLGNLWGDRPAASEAGGSESPVAANVGEGSDQAGRARSHTEDTSITATGPAGGAITANGSRAGDDAPPVPPAPTGIVGYDSLSASQVVQRLAGLDKADLEAVREYESATRGRATILSRAGQLLSSTPG